MAGPPLVINGISETLASLRALPGRVGASKIRPAIMEACQPTLEALKANTPKGPTGNLLRAAAIKSVEYAASGSVVVIVGYIRAGTATSTKTGGKYQIGPDRAFHQHWIESGTQDRRLKKGVIASSLNTTGGTGAAYFKSKGFNAKALVMSRSASGDAVITMAEGIVVFRPKNGMIGAVKAAHPMQRAFDSTADEVESRAKRILEDALVTAVEELRGS